MKTLSNILLKDISDTFILLTFLHYCVCKHHVHVFYPISIHLCKCLHYCTDMFLLHAETKTAFLHRTHLLRHNLLARQKHIAPFTRVKNSGDLFCRGVLRRQANANLITRYFINFQFTGHCVTRGSAVFPVSRKIHRFSRQIYFL